MFKDILKWTAIGGIFFIPAILPFIVSSSMFFPFITGKNFTFRIIVEIITACWVLLAFMDPRYRPRPSWILSAIAFFVIVIGLADFTGTNAFKSFWSNFERMEGYVTILHLFAYFVVTGTILNSEKFWKAFFYTSLVASVLVAFIGLSPMFGGESGFAFVRIDARFGNPIYLAVYSLIHAYIAVVLMTKWKGVKWHLVLLGAVALLHSAVVAFTQTRGTMLGLLGGALIATFLIAVFQKESKKLRIASLGLLLLVAGLIGTGFMIKDTEYAKTTPLVNRFTQVDLSSGTIHARFMNWGMAWEGVKERPILGWGQGNYEYVFSKYFDPGMYAEEPWFDRTHNIFFDWLVSAGFLGLIAYLLLPISLLTHMWFIERDDSKWSFKRIIRFEFLTNLFKDRDRVFSTTERAVWTGFVGAYMIHNFFVFDNIISYILFFSILAYIHFRVTEDKEPLWSDVRVENDTVVSVALPVTLVLTGLIVWYINIPGIQTSQILIDALTQEALNERGQVVRQSPEDILGHYRKATAIDQLGRQEAREQLAQMAANMYRSEAVNQQTKLAFQELAITEMQKEVNRNPNSPRLLLFEGSIYGSFGQIDKAEEVLKKVIELTPTKQAALYQLGEVLLIQDKDEEALEHFKFAYEIETENDEAARLFALALIRNGKDKEAVDLLTEHFGSPYVDDNRLFIEWTNAERFDIVATMLENRIEKNPQDIQVKVSLAAAYKELNEKDKAVKLLEEVIESNPEYTEQMETFIKEIRGW